jgi:hypothetical protein
MIAYMIKDESGRLLKDTDPDGTFSWIFNKKKSGTPFLCNRDRLVKVEITVLVKEPK